MSELAGSLRPGRKVLASASAGWKSVPLETYEQPGCVEQYETASSLDPLVVAVLEDAHEMESFTAGSWRETYTPEVVGVAAPTQRIVCGDIRRMPLDR